MIKSMTIKIDFVNIHAKIYNNIIIFKPNLVYLNVQMELILISMNKLAKAPVVKIITLIKILNNVYLFVSLYINQIII